MNSRSKTKTKISEQQEFERRASTAINSVLNDSSLEDDQLEHMFDAILDVLLGRMQSGTAAKNYGVVLSDLEVLLQTVRRKLNLGQDGTFVANKEDNQTQSQSAKSIEPKVKPVTPASQPQPDSVSKAEENLASQTSFLSQPALNQTQDNSSALTPTGRRLIGVNDRWKEYPQVVEDIVDEVLAKMMSRNEADLVKKAAMKAGILDVVRLGITLKKAHEERSVGESTIRRYSRQVKVMLGEHLGDGMQSPEFLRPFDTIKGTLTLAQIKAGPPQPGSKIDSSSSSNDNNNDHSALAVVLPAAVTQGKRSSVKRRSSVKVKDNVTTAESAEATKPKRPRSTKKESAADLQVVAKDQQSGSAHTSHSQTTTSGNSLDMIPTLTPSCLSLMQKRASTMPVLLSAGKRNRRAFRGTPDQIREMCREALWGRYNGGVDEMAGVLTTAIVSNWRVNKALGTIPMEIVVQALYLVGRFFEIENTEIVEDEEQDMND